MRTLIVCGKHPQLGRLWAAIDPTVRYVQPELRSTKFSALLAPYASEADALAAFQRIGATIEREHGPR